MCGLKPASGGRVCGVGQLACGRLSLLVPLTFVGACPEPRSRRFFAGFQNLPLPAIAFSLARHREKATIGPGWKNATGSAERV